MDLKPSPLRIGVVDQTVSGWAAAAVYSRMTLRSLEAACEPGGPELFFLAAQGNQDQLPADSRVKSMQVTATDYLPAEQPFRKLFRLPEKSGAFRGESRLRKILRLTSKSDPFGIARENKIDVLLPLLDLPPWPIAPRTIGWIPDFQHLHLPEFFSPADVQRKNTSMRRLAERATMVMLSSQSAQDDFARFAPEHAHKARVVSFPSLLVFDALANDPEAARHKYNLPEKFVLVANQFWAHKNHALVVQALDILHKRGIDIPVVMTGLPSDHRDPSNKTLSSLLQAIAVAGLNRQVTILGLVPYNDLINLMRTAAVIIQPSRFEGWSTVVQDALALGRPLLCSDIPVHREQVPDGPGFFPVDEPEVLAKLLATHWESLTPGPSTTLEQQSMDQERAFAMRHGKALLNLCVEAAGR
jgi:glycosyltransferase involved in cell wall biosynthesis